MTDKNLANLFSKFIVDNPEKIPKELTIKDDGVDGWPTESWDPTVHSDAEDRFFIQGSGQSLWKVFYDNKELMVKRTKGQNIIISINNSVKCH